MKAMIYLFLVMFNPQSYLYLYVYNLYVTKCKNFHRVQFLLKSKNDKTKLFWLSFFKPCYITITPILPPKYSIKFQIQQSLYNERQAVKFLIHNNTSPSSLVSFDQKNIRWYNTFLILTWSSRMDAQQVVKKLWVCDM